MRKILNQFDLAIPVILGLTVVKYKNNKKIIIIDSDDFFLNIYNCSSEILKIDEATQAISYYKKKTNLKIKLIEAALQAYIKSWDAWFFLKIKYKGKGYRVKRRKKILKFFFWLSHMNLIRIINFKIKRIGNYRYLLLGVNKQKLKKTAFLVKSVRKNDLFTKRGLRLAKQIIIKKKAKKSSYIK